jgi:hypothetical protein
LPVRQFGIQDDLSWGLVRVGIYSSDAVSDDALFEMLNGSKALEIFANGVLMMLQKAIELTGAVPCD